MDEKIKGIILRSKICWAEEGEKSTKYFYTLEKRNAVNKNISNLKVGNMLVSEPKKYQTKNILIFLPYIWITTLKCLIKIKY